MGQFGVMIEWSWRVEDRCSIICGSWSEEQLWRPSLDRLSGKTVVDLNVFARLPEITIALTEHLHVSSFMTAEGEPQWALFDRRTDETTTLGVRGGVLRLSR